MHMRRCLRGGLMAGIALMLGICGTATLGEEPALRATTAAGMVELAEGDRPILRYRYETLEPEDEYLAQLAPQNRRYARPRSNYIHPLYGPDGQELTADLSPDHPHHRGIYWAWPEVGYDGRVADLHALQGVFARPTGQIETRITDRFAEIVATNQWLWEDRTPIVREVVTIRAYRATEHDRWIDLRLELTALVDGVTIARRDTTTYGGLNMRFAPLEDLKFVHHADPPDVPALPRMAWIDTIGRCANSDETVGVAIFEKATNPDYPNDAIRYPELPWHQTTFPRSGTRYSLSVEKPLVLEYRLWIRGDAEVSEAAYRQQWRLFNEGEETR